MKAKWIVSWFLTSFLQNETKKKLRLFTKAIPVSLKNKVPWFIIFSKMDISVPHKARKQYWQESQHTLTKRAASYIPAFLSPRSWLQRYPNYPGESVTMPSPSEPTQGGHCLHLSSQSSLSGECLGSLGRHPVHREGKTTALPRTVAISCLGKEMSLSKSISSPNIKEPSHLEYSAHNMISQYI